MRETSTRCLSSVIKSVSSKPSGTMSKECNMLMKTWAHLLAGWEMGGPSLSWSSGLSRMKDFMKRCRRPFTGIFAIWPIRRLKIRYPSMNLWQTTWMWNCMTRSKWNFRRSMGKVKQDDLRLLQYSNQAIHLWITRALPIWIFSNLLWGINRMKPQASVSSWKNWKIPKWLLQRQRSYMLRSSLMWPDTTEHSRRPEGHKQLQFSACCPKKRLVKLCANNFRLLQAIWKAPLKMNRPSFWVRWWLMPRGLQSAMRCHSSMKLNLKAPLSPKPTTLARSLRPIQMWLLKCCLFILRPCMTPSSQCSQRNRWCLSQTIHSFRP